jgi:glucose dehydrogenase
VPYDHADGAGEPAKKRIGENAPTFMYRYGPLKQIQRSGIKVLRQAVQEHEGWLSQQDQWSGECHQYQMLRHMGSEPVMI